jgi:hypothetical protein
VDSVLVVPNTITFGATTQFLGVIRYASKVSGGADRTLAIFGGNGTPTRLESPTLNAVVPGNDGGFTNVATQGSGALVTNLAFGGRSVTQQLGTASGGSGSVTLTTNAVLALDSTPGDWTASRTLAGPSTNNGVSVPTGDGYVAVDGVSWPAARCETAMTNTWQTRNVFSRIVDAGEIQTNVTAVRVIYAGSSATATQSVNFIGITSNTFASVTVTTAGTYTATASLFATNRRWHVQIPIWVPAAVGTNAGWVSMPAVEVVKQ